MERILNKHMDEYKIPEPDATILLEYCLQCCQAKSCISNYNNLQVGHVTMKAHYMVHACSRAKYLHPRFGWCFRGEDFMGKIRTVAAASIHGSRKEIVHQPTSFLDGPRTGLLPLPSSNNYSFPRSAPGTLQRASWKDWARGKTSDAEEIPNLKSP